MQYTTNIYSLGSRMISVVFFCLCCLVLSNVRCLREREKASMRRTCRNTDSWIRVFDSFIYLVSVDFWSKSDRYFRSISFFICSLNSRAFVYTKIKHILNFSFCLSSSTQIWLEYDLPSTEFNMLYDVIAVISWNDWVCVCDQDFFRLNTKICAYFNFSTE